MSKPPTAEQVLELYLNAVSAERTFRFRENDYGSDLFDNWMDARLEFENELTRWQASRGPVTREWIEGRFAGELEDCPHCGEWIRVRRGHVSVTWIDGDVILGIEDQHNDLHFAHRKMINPTREDIERFLLVTGGPELT